MTLLNQTKKCCGSLLDLCNTEKRFYVFVLFIILKLNAQDGLTFLATSVSESSRSLGNGLNIFVMLQQSGCFIHMVRGSFMILEVSSEQQEVLLKDRMGFQKIAKNLSRLPL